MSEPRTTGECDDAEQAAVIPMSTWMFRKLKRRDYIWFSLPRAMQLATQLGLRIEIEVKQAPSSVS